MDTRKVIDIEKVFIKDRLIGEKRITLDVPNLMVEVSFKGVEQDKFWIIRGYRISEKSKEKTEMQVLKACKFYTEVSPYEIEDLPSRPKFDFGV